MSDTDGNDSPGGPKGQVVIPKELRGRNDTVILRRRYEGRPPVSVSLLEVATLDNFDTDGYLWLNTDVVAAREASADPDFALHHLEVHGIREGRYLLNAQALPAVSQIRRAKLAKLRERSPHASTRLDLHTESFCGQSSQALKVRGDSQLPAPYDRISFNFYDPEIDAWIDDNPNSFFLDAGSGLRNIYRENVLNAEIAMLPSTDLLCFGHSIPLDDDTFDGVVCLAVLEHVPNPFLTAEELVRVVKPGGRIVVDWPFIAPLHGYPHHYFNATPEGARYAFERIECASVVESTIPPNFHPVFALRSILDDWQAALAADRKDHFLQLRVGDILEAFSGASLCNPWKAEVLRESWVNELPKTGQVSIAAGTRVVVTKDAR